MLVLSRVVYRGQRSPTEGLVRLIEAVVDLPAALRVQLFAGAGNG